MHPSLWNPISNCAAIILNKKKTSRRDEDDVSKDSSQQRRQSILRRLQVRKLRKALEEDFEYGSLTKSYDIESASAADGSTDRWGSLAGLHAQKEFLGATAKAMDGTFDSFDSIPELEECYGKFVSMYPSYQSSDAIDHLRSDEYSHLDEAGAKVCLDYCGFGLFSYAQSFPSSKSSGFSISEITSNLNHHATQGGTEEGTAEHDIKTRILEFLNIPENEYDLVFTVSRGSAFRLLAESYPFQPKRKLLTMFDHDSQSVIWMSQRAREMGSKVHNASFKWPTLKVCNSELRKLMLSKKRRRKKDSPTGLFVFPIQSRVSGVKYPYQWMALAQQNHWHCLLDAGSLGPKDMTSLGLWFYRPDFIITSFYRVFGADPTGFGCLLIKKSVMGCLGNQNAATGFGMVRIYPIFPDYLAESLATNEEQIEEEEGTMLPVARRGSQMPAFSGALMLAEVRDAIETEMNRDSGSEKDGSGTVFEGSQSLSFGEVMKSPLFTEDDSSDNSLWIELGQSPFGSDNSGLLGAENLDSPFPPPWFSSKKKNPMYEDIQEDAEIIARGLQEENFTSEMYEEGAVDSRRISLKKEIEGGFRLIGRMRGKEKNEQFVDLGRRVSFCRNSNEREPSEHEEDDGGSEDEEEQMRREQEIVCRYIDHVNMVDQNKITSRLRCLVNWLVTSLLRLRLPASDGADGQPLVRMYGPRIKFERGASVAFNVRHRRGGLVHPEAVQKMAERNGISLAIGFLSHIRVNQDALDGLVELTDHSLCAPMPSGLGEDGPATIRIEVVTASLGFLTNFEDVYKLWAFLARFLDPAFVESDGLSTIDEISEA